MKRIRYSKYVPDPAGEMSMEDLLSALSDYLLQSGFQDSMWYEMPEGEQTLDELKRAIEEALLNGEMFDENLREQIEQMMADGQLDELIEQLIERMQQEDYISIDEPHDPARQSSVGGQTGEAQQAQVRDHRQEPRLSRIQVAAQSAWVAGQVELRPPRHARSGDRHRGQRIVEDLRVRRHAESRHHRDALERDPARRADAAAEHRILRPAGAPVRVPVVVRDGADARLLALDDPLRRRPLHAGEESGDGAVASDPHAVSRATRCRWCCSMIRRRRFRCRNWRG